MTYKTKPGFVRVFIPARNKYTRIRSQHANNPNYLQRNGMVVVAEPVAPPVYEDDSMKQVVEDGQLVTYFNYIKEHKDDPGPPSTIQDRYPSTPTIQADDVVASEVTSNSPATTPAKSKRSKPKSTK